MLHLESYEEYANKFSTEEARAKEHLRQLGAIDKYLNILDYAKFMNALKPMRDKYKAEYDLDCSWFFADGINKKKAVPNKEMFKKIDVIRGINY